jgi:hypothetical protein
VRNRPVLFKEGNFWFVLDTTGELMMCGSWLSAYTISRFLIVYNWCKRIWRTVA